MSYYFERSGLGIALRIQLTGKRPHSRLSILFLKSVATTMASLAICRTRLRQSASLTKKVQESFAKEIIFPREKDTEASEKQSLLECPPIDLPPLETRLQWMNSISNFVLNREGLAEDSGVRDWDFILSLDGSVENRAENAATSLLPTRHYPARYQIPSAIYDRLDSVKSQVWRAERFALGTILYQVQSGKLLFSDLSEGETEVIRPRFVNGEFPDDVWDLPYATRILACWCPNFGKDMLAAHSKNSTF
jgi:hypothetical protein